MDVLQRLIAARDLYYATGTSDLTDDEYDALKFHVEEMGHQVSNLAPPPPGTDWKVISHRRHMGSMPACATTGQEMEELAKKHGGLGFTSLKYDGLSVELQYTDGKLTAAVLRGDGDQGEDVYANVRHVQCVPPNIPVEGNISVYGELVVSWNNLEALNELRVADGKTPYKSPRNAVALVRSKSVPRSWLPNLRVRVFDVHPRPFIRQDETMEYIKRINMHLGGVALRKFDPVDVGRQTATVAWQSRGQANDVRNNMQYQVDGLVFRCDGGDCIKLKFPAEAAVTTVRGVVEQLGRTGVITPVVEFDAVNLVGADVRRATGHNVELMTKRLEGLGIGAKVLVSRRGDVIPHVEEVVSPSESPWAASSTCPSCGSEVVQDGSIRRCSADPFDCPGTSMGLILKFCREVGIKDLGPGVVAALMNAGIVNTPVDLYLMDPETLHGIQLGGGSMGPRVATRIVNSVWEHHRLSWGELLGSVGIPGCAKSVMEDVAQAYPDPEELKKVTRYRLAMIDGVGPIRAEKIAAYLDTRWNDVIEPLLQVIDLRSDSGPLDGRVFCITLGLRSGGRAEMEARIRSAGGSTKSSVSKKVTHVVCNQPDAGTSKLKRAIELGVPIISEETLVEMMGEEFEEPEVDENAEF